MEEIWRSPGEVGSLSHYLQFFKSIPGGCLGFLNHQQYLLLRSKHNALKGSWGRSCRWTVGSFDVKSWNGKRPKQQLSAVSVPNEQ